MSKKCTHCNTVHEDHVIYCPNCGRKIEGLAAAAPQPAPQPAPQSKPVQKKINWVHPAANEKLLELPYIEWLPLVLTVVGVFLAWEVHYFFALFTGIIPLCILKQNEQTVAFKVPFVTRVLAVINLVLFAYGFWIFEL